MEGTAIPPPLAYFLSWTTKGSWLPGDDRGWVMRDIPGIQEPDAERYERARRNMNENEVVLDPSQRAIVNQTISDHCRIRGWVLHTVNARTNHVHVVVTANDYQPETVMEQFKAWCSRRLNEQAGRKHKWWTEHGSTRWINDHEYLHNAINYVANRQ